MSEPNTFELKPISHDTVAGALAKAERYRLLNEPNEAESICCDILEVEPNNQQALVSLILALTDQIAHGAGAFANAMARIAHLDSGYDRAYYAGIAWERRAKARCVEAARAPATTPTNGLSRPCGCLRKPNTCGPRAMTTPFSVGILAFVSSRGIKNLSLWWRIKPSRFCRND